MPVNRKRQIDAGSDAEPQLTKKSRTEAKAAKTPKTAKNDAEKGTDAEGNTYWEVSRPRSLLECCFQFINDLLQVGKNRRVSSSQFKGNTLVNIREYYTAPDGELKPGKKVKLVTSPSCLQALTAVARESHSLWINTRRSWPLFHRSMKSSAHKDTSWTTPWHLSWVAPW
jgi:hypothetical protein